MDKDLIINFGIFKVKIIRPLKIILSLGPTATRSITFDEGTGPVDISLGDNQFTNIHLSGLDAAGLAGQFVNPPVWVTADPTILLATPESDGSACRIEAASPVKLGTTTLTVTDADDPTVPALVFNVTISPEAITKLGATVDPPTEKSPTP